MLIGLTTLFASAFCFGANRFSDAKFATSEPYALVAILAFLTIWVLWQGVYWARSKFVVCRISRKPGMWNRKRRLGRELRRAIFQLQISLSICLIGGVFCVGCLVKSSKDGAFHGRFAASERVATWIQNMGSSLFVEDPSQETSRKGTAGKSEKTEDETFVALKRSVDQQAKEMREPDLLVENKSKAEDEVEDESSDVASEAQKKEKVARLPGEVVFIPYVDSAEIQEEPVSSSDADNAQFSSPTLSGSFEKQGVKAPNSLRLSTTNGAAPVRNLQDEPATTAPRANVRTVSAAKLDHAFFEAREDHEAQRRLNERFTPDSPLAPLPASLATPRSKYRSVNYEEKIEDGTSEGLLEGIWSKDGLNGVEGDDKSILVQIDEESNRISSLVRACVLPIETRKSAPGSRVVEEETGCGFLTQYNGKVYVVTNNHVVNRALSNDAIKIFLPNNQTISPTKIFPCDDFDLAALEVSADKLPKDGSVTLCRFGDSDSVRVANSVYAIGNPFGLEKSLSYGHVSSLRRCNRDLISANPNLLPEYIQIDAAINPGNSGGPLYDSRGDVVGIVTAIATTSGKNEGVAFAIPINVALRVVKTMIDGGVWRRSRLGVELEPATRADLASTNLPYVFGAKIVEITSQSPAQTAGLKPGDVVLSFNGKQVENDVHLARLIALADASELATVGVLRGSNYFEVGAKLERAATAN